VLPWVISGSRSQHKFTKELCRGTIDMNVMGFLIQDHRFLDAFIVLLSSTIAHAQSGGSNSGLYERKHRFERCFEKLVDLYCR
jgi:thiaminase